MYQSISAEFAIFTLDASWRIHVIAIFNTVSERRRGLFLQPTLIAMDDGLVLNLDFDAGGAPKKGSVKKGGSWTQR